MPYHGLFIAALLLFELVTYIHTWHIDELFSNFEVLSYSTMPALNNHKRVRRSANGLSSSITVYIFAFNRNLTLVLSPDKDLWHSAGRLTLSGNDYWDGFQTLRDSAYRGYVENNPNSDVYGTIRDGIFSGVISLGEAYPGYYYVEPAGKYFNDSRDFHSIIYNDSHIKDTHGQRVRRSVAADHSDSFCGLSNPSIVKGMASSANRIPRSADSPFADRVVRHAARSSFRHTADAANTPLCTLFLRADPLLWDRVMSMSHVAGNRDSAVKEITSILMQHVQGVREIYRKTIFQNFAGDVRYDGINFQVEHIHIDVSEEVCKGRNGDSPSSSADSPFCSPNIGVSALLNLHSSTDRQNVCLSYLFTYRDFSGVSGLAWVASAKDSFGACDRFRLVFDQNGNDMKSSNTGLVTLIRHNYPIPIKISILTFAHELGHNLGARHDDDFKQSQYGCLPSPSDSRGYYVMFSAATSGNKDNNDKFSVCSLDSITRVLHNRVTSPNTCFRLGDEGPVCGNQLVERGEACDCGYSQLECRDQCCMHKQSSTPCQLARSVTVDGVLLNVLCSPTAGECCTGTCQLHNTSRMCRGADECNEASFCNGKDAECPSTKRLPDLTPCQGETRVCKQGQCTGSICERISGWQECLPTDDEGSGSERLCYISCRRTDADSPCISALDLEQNHSLRRNNLDLAVVILRDNRGLRLKPGSPCAGFSGYCDYLSRCRLVNAEGPLSRLQKLIFSPQVIGKVKSWITLRWWAVILICLGVIVVMIGFVKSFAYNTPRSRGLSLPPDLIQRSAHGRLPPSVRATWHWIGHLTLTRPGGRKTPRHPNFRSHLVPVERHDSADFLPMHARRAPISCARNEQSDRVPASTVERPTMEATVSNLGRTNGKERVANDRLIPTGGGSSSSIQPTSVCASHAPSHSSNLDRNTQNHSKPKARLKTTGPDRRSRPYSSINTSGNSPNVFPVNSPNDNLSGTSSDAMYALSCVPPKPSDMLTRIQLSNFDPGAPPPAYDDL